MPFCPKCRYEYVQDVVECLDCGEKLVDKLPPENDSEFEQDQPALLMTVRDTVEAGMVESLLRSYGIPVLKSYNESGGYLSVIMGDTVFGVKIFVPSRLLEKAKEVTAPDNNINIGECEETPREDMGTEDNLSENQNDSLNEEPKIDDDDKNDDNDLEYPDYSEQYDEIPPDETGPVKRPDSNAAMWVFVIFIVLIAVVYLMLRR